MVGVRRNARWVRKRRIRWVLPDPGSPYRRTDVLFWRSTVLSTAPREVWKALRPISETSPSSVSQGSPTIQFENGLLNVAPQRNADVVIPGSVKNQIPAIGIAQP